MNDTIVVAMVSAGSAVVGGALGVVGTLWQSRVQERMERRRNSGEVETSDASVLWQTLMEDRRELAERQRALGDRLDRLMERLERLVAQLTDVVARIDALSRDIQALAAAQRSLEEAVRNGGAHG